MIEFVSVLNTFATAIAPVMRMKQFMSSCTVSPMSRLARASSALFVRYVRYHSLPVILSAMISFMPISTARASSAPKDRYAYIVLPYVPCSLWKANGVARLLISLSSMMPSELAASVGSALTGRTIVGQMDAYALMGEGKVFTIAPTGRSYESRSTSSSGRATLL